jgi:hypothetical protein
VDVRCSRAGQRKRFKPRSRSAGKEVVGRGRLARGAVQAARGDSTGAGAHRHRETFCVGSASHVCASSTSSSAPAWGRASRSAGSSPIRSRCPRGDGRVELHAGGAAGPACRLPAMPLAAPGESARASWRPAGTPRVAKVSTSSVRKELTARATAPLRLYGRRISPKPGTLAGVIKRFLRETRQLLHRCE